MAKGKFDPSNFGKPYPIPHQIKSHLHSKRRKAKFFSKTGLEILKMGYNGTIPRIRAYAKKRS
jgi:hypothetical protein